MLLREAAAKLNLDPAVLSKFERGERIPNQEQVLSFAQFYGENENVFIKEWFSDKIFNELKNEPLSREIIKAAVKKLNFTKNKIE